MSRRWSWQRMVWGELVAEFLGTFTLIAFGDGVVAMAVAALNRSGRGTLLFAASGDWLLIAWGWGLAVVLGVYLAGGVSGAHVNPAASLGLALRRGFEWRKVPSYWAAQLLGAFTGATLVYLNYRDAIASFETAHHIARGTSGSVPTFSIFATFPAPYFHTWVGPFVDQVIGTAFLMALVLAVIDEFNTPVQANLAPLIIGFIVVAIGVSFGANAGYAINPARDLGPRLLAWAEGWKSIAVPGDYGTVNGHIGVPIVGPLLGAGVGALLYDGLIRNVLVARGAKPSSEVEEQGRTAIEQD